MDYPPQQDLLGDFVTDRDHIRHYNKTTSCVCGEDDTGDITIGRFYQHYWCRNCHRQYFGGESIIDPREVLSTSADGLVHASEDWSAYYLLTEQERWVQDYIEFDPRGEDEAWLWAHEGLFIGYLLFMHGSLHAFVIAEGFRGNDHGTRFLNAWWKQFEEQESVKVLCPSELIPFYKQTDVQFSNL